MTEYEQDPEQEYERFWKELLEKDGVLNMEQLKKELADYSMLLRMVPTVYDHITGGRVSKPNTDASVVISLADEETERIVERSRDELLEELQDLVYRWGKGYITIQNRR